MSVNEPVLIKKFSKKVSESIDLFGEQIVAGNISKKNYQAYHMYYYPVDEKKRGDKVRVVFYLKPTEPDGTYERTSIYFMALPQYRHFILFNIKAYFKWLMNRIEPNIPKERILEYRREMLKGFLIQIAEETPEIWKK